MLTAVLILSAFFVAAVVENVYVSIQRSRQKQTMAVMSFAWRDKRTPPPDAWGHPMRVRNSGRHTVFRAAAADGRFESVPDPRMPRVTEEWNADIVMVNGRFMQYPNGICGGDEPNKGPLGNCASCHPHQIAKR
jgi:hypothetical protein